MDKNIQYQCSNNNNTFNLYQNNISCSSEKHPEKEATLFTSSPTGRKGMKLSHQGNNITSAEQWRRLDPPDRLDEDIISHQEKHQKSERACYSHSAQLKRVSTYGTCLHQASVDPKSELMCMQIDRKSLALSPPSLSLSLHSPPLTALSRPASPTHTHRCCSASAAPSSPPFHRDHASVCPQVSLSTT